MRWYCQLVNSVGNDSSVICTSLFENGFPLWYSLHFNTLYPGHLFTVMECTREGSISVKVYPFMEIGTYVLSCPLLLPLSPFIGSNPAVTSIIWGCVCVCVCGQRSCVCPQVQSLWEIIAFQSLQIIPAASLNNIKRRLLKPFRQTTWNVRRMRVCGNT